jgi:hypothetical protein
MEKHTSGVVMGILTSMEGRGRSIRGEVNRRSGWLSEFVRDGVIRGIENSPKIPRRLAGWRQGLGRMLKKVREGNYNRGLFC